MEAELCGGTAPLGEVRHSGLQCCAAGLVLVQLFWVKTLGWLLLLFPYF